MKTWCQVKIQFKNRFKYLTISLLLLYAILMDCVKLCNTVNKVCKNYTRKAAGAALPICQ